MGRQHRKNSAATSLAGYVPMLQRWSLFPRSAWKLLSGWLPSTVNQWWGMIPP